MTTHFPDHENYIGFLNPAATGYRASQPAIENSHPLWVASEEQAQHILELPRPKHIQEGIGGLTLIYSRGGDGTVNKTVAAIVGHHEDDPEATARNFGIHAELNSAVRYLAAAGGNANNFALSALGKLASRPERITATSHVYVGQHRPIFYEVTDGDGSLSRTGISTSCIGVGGSARVATELHNIKNELKQKHAPTRLVHEAGVAFRALIQAPAFSAELRLAKHGNVQRLALESISGFESIGSRRYAKQGRTNINIDDTRQQLIVARHAGSRLGQAAHITEAFTRLKLGRHTWAPLDFEEVELALKITSDEPVPFHSDGEVGPRYILAPGATLKLKLGRLAVPTYMAH